MPEYPLALERSNCLMSDWKQLKKRKTMENQTSGFANASSDLKKCKSLKNSSKTSEKSSRNMRSSSADQDPNKDHQKSSHKGTPGNRDHHKSSHKGTPADYHRNRHRDSSLAKHKDFPQDIPNGDRRTRSSSKAPGDRSKSCDSRKESSQRKSRVRSPEEILSQLKPVINEIFTCLECREIFSNFSELRVHFHSKHCCFVCNEYFVKITDLQKHIKTHHQSKFPCTICKHNTKPFNSPESLLIHCSLRHSKNFEIMCPVRCKKTSAEMMGHLRKHMQRDAEKYQRKHRMPACSNVYVYISLLPQWERTSNKYLSSLVGE